MPEEIFTVHPVHLEQRWYKLSWLSWMLLGALFAASASSIIVGGGPFAHRITEAEGIRVEWERVVYAHSTAPVRFVVEPRNGEAQLTLRLGLLPGGGVRDITPPPTDLVGGKDSLTLIYKAQPGAASVQMQQTPATPGILHSIVEANGTAVHLEQIVLP